MSNMFNPVGSVQIDAFDWVRLPTLVETNQSLLKVSYTGNLNKISTHGFLRAYYPTANVYQGNWLRLFPKAGEEVFYYPKPAGLEETQRFFEFKQRPNYIRGTPYGSYSEEQWGIHLSASVVDRAAETALILAKLEEIQLDLNALKVSQRSIYQLLLSSLDLPTETILTLPDGRTISLPDLQQRAFEIGQQLNYY